MKAANSCVEAAAAPGTVHVRDSKDVHGPPLAFTNGAPPEFVSYVVPHSN